MGHQKQAGCALWDNLICQPCSRPFIITPFPFESEWFKSRSGQCIVMGSLPGDKFNLANKKWCRARNLSPLWLIFVCRVCYVCVWYSVAATGRQACEWKPWELWHGKEEWARKFKDTFSLLNYPREVYFYAIYFMSCADSSWWSNGWDSTLLMQGPGFDPWSGSWVPHAATRS